MSSEPPSDDIQINVEQISSQLRIRPSIYIKLVMSFAGSLTEKMNLISEALAVNDREKVRMILHEIKGTAGNLRLFTITGPEAVLHVALKAGEAPDVLARHFEILRSEVAKLQNYVLRLKDPSEGPG